MAMVLGVAAGGCGGGASDAPAPATAQQPAAAPIVADATAGELGPASRTSPEGTREIGRRRPLVERKPRPGRPGGGVAGEGVCTDGQTTADLLCYLNAERAAAGLPGLRADTRLTSAAQAMAGDMVERHFFSHTGPDGSSVVVDRIKPTGYLPSSGAWVVGENLAWGSGALASARSIVAGWMNSPGHRANVLANDYRDIGLGVLAGAPLSGRTGGLTWVAEFGVRTPTASRARTGPGRVSTAAVPSAIGETIATAAAHGLRVPVRCPRRCSVRLRVYRTRAAAASARRSAVIGYAARQLRHGGRVVVHVRIRRRALAGLRRRPPVRLVLSTRISGRRAHRTLVRLR